MINYLSFTNSKLKADDIFTWGIPAGKSKTGRVTCPAAGACATGCYAKQGFYVMPNVAASQERRLALSLTDEFVDVIDAEIKRRGVQRMRIHDSGDFYSWKYLSACIAIVTRNPGVKFYAYTKMVRLFKSIASEMPPNFHVIFSEGGTQDALIDTSSDRHSRVFASRSALKRAKYSDASESDRPSLAGKKRIGLVYHGAPSREWVTA